MARDIAVIVTLASPALPAAQAVTKSVPIVFLTGFDHAGFKNQSIGSLMFEQVARDCIERGEAMLDFTIGDEPYKLTFGADPKPMWQVSRAGSPF